jgi:hypothetical protein
MKSIVHKKTFSEADRITLARTLLRAADPAKQKPGGA